MPTPAPAAPVERHHWLNTIVGLLDVAFHLSDEEQFYTSDIVARLLDSLHIPERESSGELPPALALEVASGFYTMQLNSHRDSGVVRPIRAVAAGDVPVSLETWREAVLTMITTAYVLNPLERLVATKVLTDLLAAIGVPERHAAFFPDSVVRAYKDCG